MEFVCQDNGFDIYELDAGEFEPIVDARYNAAPVEREQFDFLPCEDSVYLIMQAGIPSYILNTLNLNCHCWECDFQDESSCYCDDCDSYQMGYVPTSVLRRLTDKEIRDLTLLGSDVLFCDKQ